MVAYLIAVEEVKKAFQKKQVLNGASFRVEKGDAVGIIGRNGCGKSTLLSIMAGAVRPDSGHILYQGEEALANRRLFSKYVAYVPQENPIIEELSVYDNLKLWYSFGTEDLKRSLTEGTPYHLGLSEFLKAPAGKLSGGMKKRLSIAQALANNAPVLILDEFSAALDLIMKEEILSYLSEYKKSGGTIVMTTHEERDLAFCNKLFILKEGRLFPLPLEVSKEALIQAIQ